MKQCRWHTFYVAGNRSQRQSLVRGPARAHAVCTRWAPVWCSEERVSSAFAPGTPQPGQAWLSGCGTKLLHCQSGRHSLPVTRLLLSVALDDTASVGCQALNSPLLKSRITGRLHHYVTQWYTNCTLLRMYDVLCMYACRTLTVWFYIQ